MERNPFFLQELGSSSPGFLELESQKIGTQKGMHNLANQVRALQWRRFDDFFLSFNGSWMDNDSDAEGDANEIAFSNKDGDKVNATLTPVCPTTLFNNKRTPVSHLMERDATSILDGISLYSPALLHGTSQETGIAIFPLHMGRTLLENHSSSIQLDDWGSL
jgi:hypothetical protein